VAKRSKTPAQIKAEIERLNKQLADAEAREGERIGAIAIKAGLHEIDAADSDLLKAFKALAARFRGEAQQPDTPA
jgi:hypothetical protein